MNDNIYNYDIEIDPKQIIETVEKSNAKPASDLPKVVWHNLPNDDKPSTWRFLPYFKKKTFFLKIEKHWDVPGEKSRTVTCPSSFTNPSTGKPFPCAICEERWKIYKNKNKTEGDEVIRKALQTQTNYLTNAINMEEPEKGIGVLALSYTIWQSLVAFLSNPYTQNFFQVKTGKNVWIKATYKAGTVVPGGSGKQKRDYTVQVTESNPIEDVSILEGLYDLETVLGIPTYETTKGWLQKLLTGDPNAGEEFLSGTLYHNRLGDGSIKPEESLGEPQAMNQQNVPSQSKPVVASGLPSNTLTTNLIPQTFAVPLPVSDHSTEFNFGQNEDIKFGPTTKMGDDGFPVCYSESFDENNKVCLRCNFADDCETSILKRQREARKNASHTTTHTVVKEEPVDDVAAEMLRILSKGK